MRKVALKEYVERLIRLRDKVVRAKLRALAAEIHKAEISLNSRLEGMNEFREAMKDQAARTMTAGEVNALIKGLTERINKLELVGAEEAGRTKMSSALLAGVISVAVSVIAVLVSHWIGGIK